MTITKEQFNYILKLPIFSKTRDPQYRINYGVIGDGENYKHVDLFCICDYDEAKKLLKNILNFLLNTYGRIIVREKTMNLISDPHSPSVVLILKCLKKRLRF
ncbi:MAG: hypothetical protein QXU74_01510 [Candidatus Aenigmatarchaeota archaeon]